MTLTPNHALQRTVPLSLSLRSLGHRYATQTSNLLRTLTLFLLFICTLAFGQSAAPTGQRDSVLAGEPLPANFKLTLVASEKGQPIAEHSFVVATAEFATDWIPPISVNAATTPPTMLRFIGSLSVQEGGLILVRYNMINEVAIPTNIQSVIKATGERVVTPSFQFKTNRTQGSAKLKLNEPFQFLESGSRNYRLTVSPIPDKASKGQ